MSIKAHLIKQINLKMTDEEMIIEKIIEKTPTFNLNRDAKILDIFINCNCDYTNDDLTGELTMDKHTWNNALMTLQQEYTQKELKILQKITKDLENKEIVQYKCF